MCHYGYAAVTPEKRFSFRVTPSSSRWSRSSAINERNVCTSSTDNETDIFLVVKKKVCSFKTGAFDPLLVDLNLAVSIVSRVASSQ